jgi:hypothetical protein
VLISVCVGTVQRLCDQQQRVGETLTSAPSQAYDQGPFTQCCQLFSKIFGQNVPKIRPLSKIFCPLSNNSIFDSFHLNMTKKILTSKKSVKIPYFLCFLWKKYRKQNILNIRPLFGHFWEYPAKIMPQICTAAYNFTRALLSQRRLKKTVLPYPNKGTPYLFVVSFFLFLLCPINRRKLYIFYLLD